MGFLSAHEILIRYLNSSGLNAKDQVLSLFFPSQILNKTAKAVSRTFNSQTLKNEPKNKKQQIDIPEYQGKNSAVLQLAKSLKSIPVQDIFGAYIHGSLATQEEIKYSDMDVLLILNDEAIHSPKRLHKLAQDLQKIQQILFQFDPLQHHGWFVLTKSMLLNYPNTYFPPSLFTYTRSLLGEQGASFDLIISDSSDFEQPFLQLASHLIQQIEKSKAISNMFYLKSFLSEFMLLPALYVQARDKKGVYKKDSFDLAGADFPQESWQIMNQISQIRKDWNYDINGFQNWLLTSKRPIIRKVARKIAPTIPEHINVQLNPDFYSKARVLIDLMIEKRKRAQ